LRVRIAVRHMMLRPVCKFSFCGVAVRGMG
jgi:hypothetical protein